MAARGPDNKFLIGLVVGAGLGLVVASLFDPKRGARNRESLYGDRVASVGSDDPESWRDRKTERVGRKLSRRIDRIRYAGY